MNQEVLNVFNPVIVAPTFDQIRISLSEPEKIRSWSFSEIKSRDHQLPHLQAGAGRKIQRQDLWAHEGLRVLCGKYKRMKYKGIICKKSAASKSPWRACAARRMGHIELASPVACAWFHQVHCPAASP